MLSYLSERNIAGNKIKYIRFERKTLDYGTQNVFQFKILPTISSIQNAEELGYLPKNIIAMQGPFSKEMNVAILKSYKID